MTETTDFKKTTLSEKPKELKINYKEYPEFMFAMIAAFLPGDEGTDLRRVSGDVIVKSEDKYGNTFCNGLLHSYNDQPAVKGKKYKAWYKNGERHRDGDLPAVIQGKNKWWYIDGKSHREGDLPAFVSENIQRW